MRIAAPLTPDWRWERVKKAVENLSVPEDPFLADVYAVVQETKQDPDICGALYVYQIPYERDVVIAFLLSGATLQQTNQGTGIALGTLRVFEDLFMDRRTFHNKIEWRLYAQYYAKNIAIPDVKKQLMAGLANGPIVLLDHWTMGNEVVELPEREMVSRWAMTAYTKSLLARTSPIESAAAKEAFRWGAMAIKSLADLRMARTENNNDNLDAVLAIEKRKATVSADDLGISLDEIVH